MKFLLNADVGEGMASDAGLYPYLDQASIACGGHAGDEKSMRQAVKACLAQRVSIGAHPSYPDQENFGRVSLPISESGLIAILYAQIHALDQVCEALEATLSYVKPHGALYNDMMANAQVFQSVLLAVLSYPKNLALMIGAMPAARQYRDAADKAGIRLITEAFADRRYLDNGQLQPRKQKGALFKDIESILVQAQELMAHQTVTTASGEMISIAAESLCIHGDNPASVNAAEVLSRLIRA